MRLNDYLQEALKPSEYRPYVKNWDKSKYKKKFGGKYRIYLELEKTEEDKRINPYVAYALSSIGYEIENYAAGLCKKRGGKNPVRIGKVLQQNGDFDILKIFNNDPIRSGSKKNDTMVVISRHPYDIVGMSTHRGWTSCMDLHSKFSQWTGLEVEKGVLVAYLIKKDDTNITNPIGRIAIKPFFNDKNPKDVLLIPEKEVYGTNKRGFRETVVKWLDSFQSKKVGNFTFPSELYNDTLDYSYYKGNANSKKNLIIVDVQPAYYSHLHFSIVDFMEFARSHNKILIFYVPEPGGDTWEDVHTFYMDYGFPGEKLRKDCIFVEKDYGFFRNWMDNGVSDNVIKKVIREMYRLKITDSREVDYENEEIEDSYWKKFLGNDFDDFDDFIMFEDGIYLPDINLSTLKKFSGSNLAGGGRNECLKEIQLLMSSLNIRYKLVNNFIYG